MVLLAFGTFGGILLMWDKHAVECIDEAIGTFSLSSKFKSVLDQFVWAFSGVYGPNDNSERFLLWEELSGISHLWDIPWCIGGDFNVARYMYERAGVPCSMTTMGEFSNFISELGLLDLPLTGGSFTWSNNPSMSRIERFLVSPLGRTFFKSAPASFASSFVRSFPHLA